MLEPAPPGVGLNPRPFAQRYPHELSGGQRQRIGIARALAARTSLRRRRRADGARSTSRSRPRSSTCSSDLQTLGLTYLFIAHDLAVVRHMCDRIAVMYLGGIVEERAAAEMYEPPAPLHQALLSPCRVPTRTSRGSGAIILTGDVPSSIARHRLPLPLAVSLWSRRRCGSRAFAVDVPVLEGSPHAVACHFAEPILSGELKPHAQAPEWDPGIVSHRRPSRRRRSDGQARHVPARGRAESTRSPIRRPSR